jgi:hypothetical protein
MMYHYLSSHRDEMLRKFVIPNLKYNAFIHSNNVVCVAYKKSKTVFKLDFIDCDARLVIRVVQTSMSFSVSIPFHIDLNNYIPTALVVSRRRYRHV